MIVGVMSAMAEELAAVVSSLPPHEVHKIAGRTFHVVRRGERTTIYVVSRIGKVAAATTATLLVERFRVGAVLFTGLAGAVDPGLAVGDVVVADRLLQHDLDVRPLFRRYEVPMLGTTTFATDPRWSERLAGAADGFAGQVPMPLRAMGIVAPRVVRGLIVSGDRFLASTEAVSTLRRELPEALAVEMEGAAVAQVCHEVGVPCAVARVISDTADHAAAGDFGRFLTTACGPYAQALAAAAWG